MLTKIIAPLKFCGAFILVLFTSSALAEYYVVRDVISYSSCCQKTYTCKTKKHKVKKYRSHRRSSGSMATYYVWQGCGGSLWVPSCGGCTAWGPAPPPCGGPSCGDFYVPERYYLPSVDYYYDPAIDWDMRTGDDY